MTNETDSAASTDDAVDNADNGTDTTAEDKPTEETMAETESPEKGAAEPSTETETEKGKETETDTSDKDESVEKLTASDYKLPEGVPADVAKIAEELQFTQEQLDGSLAKFNELTSAQQQAQMQAVRQEGEALVREWGDDAKANLTKVRRALSINDPTGELTDALNETGFGNHPAVLRYLLNVGKQLDEGGFTSGDSNTPPPKQTAAQVLFGKTHKSVAN